MVLKKVADFHRERCDNMFVLHAIHHTLVWSFRTQHPVRVNQNEGCCSTCSVRVDVFNGRNSEWPWIAVDWILQKPDTRHIRRSSFFLEVMIERCLGVKVDQIEDSYTYWRSRTMVFLKSCLWLWLFRNDRTSRHVMFHYSFRWRVPNIEFVCCSFDPGTSQKQEQAWCLPLLSSK